MKMLAIPFRHITKVLNANIPLVTMSIKLKCFKKKKGMKKKVPIELHLLDEHEHSDNTFQLSVICRGYQICQKGCPYITLSCQ